MSYMLFASQSLLFPGGQKLKQDAFVQMMEQPFPKKRFPGRCPQCSTDVGFYQVRLPPPSTSQFPEANRQWSSMVRGETFIIKSCWFHADFQMDLLLPGIWARLPKSWGFSCQTFAILAGHNIFCHLVAYFKSFHCIFQAMEAWNVVDINGDIEAWCRRFCISRLQ